MYAYVLVANKVGAPCSSVRKAQQRVDGQVCSLTRWIAGTFRHVCSHAAGKYARLKPD